MPVASQIPPKSERRSSRGSVEVRRILFVDDDELLLRSIERVLRRHAQSFGLAANVAGSPSELLAQLGKDKKTDLLK